MKKTRTLVLLALLFLQACASPSKNEVLAARQDAGHPRPAAYAADGFYSRDGTFPERKYPPPGDFFYKHCSLGERNPYPTASEWDCPEPQ